MPKKFDTFRAIFRAACCSHETIKLEGTKSGWHLGLDDFGRKVLGCAAQRPSAVGDLLCKTKVCDLKDLFSQMLFYWSASGRNISFGSIVDCESKMFDQ